MIYIFFAMVMIAHGEATDSKESLFTFLSFFPSALFNIIMFAEYW